MNHTCPSTFRFNFIFECTFVRILCCKRLFDVTSKWNDQKLSCCKQIICLSAAFDRRSMKNMPWKKSKNNEAFFSIFNSFLSCIFCVSTHHIYPTCYYWKHISWHCVLTDSQWVRNCSSINLLYVQFSSSLLLPYYVYILLLRQLFLLIHFFFLQGSESNCIAPTHQIHIIDS